MLIFIELTLSVRRRCDADWTASVSARLRCPTARSNVLSLSVYAVVCPQMLSVALLCVCAVAFGHVSARSESGNFLDDKWLTGKWDKFRDVSNISGLYYYRPHHPNSTLSHLRPAPAPLFSLPLATLIGLWSRAPRFVVVSKRRVTGPVVPFVTRSSAAPLRQ